MAKWLHNQIVALKKQGSADIEQLRVIGETLGLAEDCLPQAPLSVVAQKPGKN